MRIYSPSLRIVFCLVLCAMAVGALGGRAAGAAWPQYAQNPFVIRMAFAISEDSSGGVVAADLDSDGLMDYLVTRPGKVGAYAHSGKQLWVLDVDVVVGASSESHGLPGHHGPGVQAGDIDGDGKTEVVFLTEDSFLDVVDGKTGKHELRKKMRSPAGSNMWEHVVIANFRGKGDRDLLLQATNKSGYRMGRYVAAYAADKLDAPPLWQTDKYLGCAHNGARIADIDLDGRDEVLGATIIDDNGRITQHYTVKGHLDSIFVYDILPDVRGLEVVTLEEGGNRIFLFNRDKLFWQTDHKRQEPQNAAVGSFDEGRPGLEVWCRSRYDTHQRPFVFDSKGKLLSEYEMDKVAPKGWTDKGVEVIWTIDWTGADKQLAVAKERHTSGDVCLFDPIGGRFIHRFKEKADRLYVADVSGDWREEIIVVSGDQIRIYHNPDKNPSPGSERLWKQAHYRRSKMTYNYYSP